MRVFVVELIQGPDSYPLGVFSDFEDMVTKLEKAAHLKDPIDIDEELGISRIEMGSLKQSHPFCNATFNKAGKIQFNFGWDMTLERFKAP